MSTRLGNSSFVNKVNPIAALDATQTMCDGDGRPSLGCMVQGVLNYTFAIAVKCRGRFVKQENRRVA